MMLDPTDPDAWGPAVDRMAKTMARQCWGKPEWYRMVANDALSAALDLDPKDTTRVLWAYDRYRALQVKPLPQSIFRRIDGKRVDE